MPLFNGLVGACEAQLVGMEQLQGQNYAANLGKKNGTLDFLFSDFNLSQTGARVAQIEGQKGQKRKVKVIYSQRATPAEIITGVPALTASICTAGIDSELLDVDVTLEKRIATPVLSFTIEQLTELCENPTAFMQRNLMTYLRAAREKLNQSYLADALAGIGPILNFSGGTTLTTAPKPVKVIAINANGERTPLFSGYNTVKLDYETMNLNGVPALIGQGILREFFDLYGYACCNSTTPFQNAVERANGAFFYDQSANAILGANEFLSIAPGAIFPLTYNKNAAMLMNNDLERHFLLPDPEIPGLMWDIDMAWDKCTEAYTWMASLWYDSFTTFQPDSFKAGDELLGITGINNYVATDA